jgi:NADPH:quinone reductase-like Zn-dependent oxidoreductase
VVAEVLRHIASGAVRVTVDRVYALSDAAAAFDYVEEGHATGKVLVEVTPGAAAGVEQRNPLRL